MLMSVYLIGRFANSSVGRDQGKDLWINERAADLRINRHIEQCQQIGTRYS
jgi:hypothetical protein